MRKLLTSVGILLLAFASCKKIENTSQINIPNLKNSLASGGCQSYPLIDSMPAVNTNADSIEYPTILGIKEVILIRLEI